MTNSKLFVLQGGKIEPPGAAVLLGCLVAWFLRKEFSQKLCPWVCYLATWHYKSASGWIQREHVLKPDLQ